jgi:hypothetical protein
VNRRAGAQEARPGAEHSERAERPLPTLVGAPVPAQGQVGATRMSNAPDSAMSSSERG